MRTQTPERPRRLADWTPAATPERFVEEMGYNVGSPGVSARAAPSTIDGWSLETGRRES